MKKVLFVMLAVCLLCVGGVVMSHAAVDITEEFTDLNFRAAVYGMIHKTTSAPIYNTDVAEIRSVDVSDRNIKDLAGLKWFREVEIFYCDGNQLTELPALREGLKELNCAGNALTALPALPDSLMFLDCYNNQLTSLPKLPDHLRILNCAGNLLTALPTLPPEIYQLMCNDNELETLPVLPAELNYLFCENNKLIGLDVTSLTDLHALYCFFNNMTSKDAVVGFTGEWDGEHFIFDPQNEATDPDPDPDPDSDAPFWSTWPPILVSLLRYVLFGWLWMNWF